MNIQPRRHWALGALVGALSGMPTLAHAAPMGFQGSAMAMGDFGENWRELYVNYALTPRDALGMSTTWMRSDDGLTTRQLDELTYTRLVKRWNMKHAQANLWFIGGIGNVHGAGHSGAMASPGVQFDYETTRLYFATTARLYRARGINHDFGSVRAGFSFFEAEYEQTQPWLIVEARRMRNLSEKIEITPMLRLINKRYFIEAGVSNMRAARFNFMTIF
jgi:hypothetical protein